MWHKKFQPLNGEDRNKQEELSFSHELGARCKDDCYIHRFLHL
jgi:hypothetical protein